MRKFLLRATLAGVAVVLGLVAVLAYLGFARHEGYFSPIFSPDGGSVYFVQRNTTGFTWGLGWEHFTAPAHAYALSDRFSLRRLDLESGQVQVVKDWPQSPAVRRHLRAYRGRIFQLANARLGFAENGELEYKVRISITRVPRSERHILSRVWDDSLGAVVEDDAWQDKDATASGYAEDSVRGTQELIALKGEEMFPAAILLRDHGDGSERILLRNGDFDDLYSEGVPARLVDEQSHFAQITRIRNLRKTQADLLARFRAAGLTEGEAYARTSKEMQRLGFYPKSPTITATKVAEAGGDLPLFEIAEMEMASGVFPDIEKAIASPGTAIDDPNNRYVIHRDYENSAKLNALLATGAKRYRVRY
ncbi:MAG: hypothetical protein ACYTFN_24480, partial [Planctomycetota bacterium]